MLSIFKTVSADTNREQVLPKTIDRASLSVSRSLLLVLYIPLPSFRTENLPLILVRL